MIIGKKLCIPDTTKAILWDMDGVLMDSLSFDFIAVNKLLRKYFKATAGLSRRYLKSIFAYDPKTFWFIIFQQINKVYGIKATNRQLGFIIREYRQMRQLANLNLCPGILKVLAELDRKNFKQAVVSNNPAKDAVKILTKSGIVKRFNIIIGNDAKALAKKPAPDSYLFAMSKLSLSPKECVVIEDTEIGVQAGKAAGCYTIGVATGGATKNQLQKMWPRADKIYTSFN